MHARGELEAVKIVDMHAVMFEKGLSCTREI